MIGLGLVWLLIGAGMAVYYATTGQAGDVRRALLSMGLGAATCALGAMLTRRASSGAGRRRS